MALSTKQERTVVEVQFEAVSEDCRVGYGRPYTVTYSDGETRRGVHTWDRPAPQVGETFVVWRA